MTKVRYDADMMKIMALFESCTGAKLKDYISNERLLFIVEENEVGKAVGKNGSNIRRLEELLKKKVKVVGFSNDIRQFIRNMIYPLQVSDIVQEDNCITITGPNTKTKGLIIGRDKQNLNHLTSVVKRYFKVEDIKVV